MKSSVSSGMIQRMKLVLNGEEYELAKDGATVADLLRALGMAGRPVAVELNKELVFKRNHGTTAIQEGDRVEVVTMVGGG